MEAIRIVLLCLGAALVCAAIRVQRPEMATVISLSVGLGVLLLSTGVLSEISDAVRTFSRLSQMEGQMTGTIVKAAGIAIVSELGVQICCDAGESALAGRIRLACRLVMLGMTMPILSEIVRSAQLLFA